MKTGIKSYECAMKIYMKKMKSHMKRYKYSYDKRGFRGFTPNKKARIYKVRFLRWTSETFQ